MKFNYEEYKKFVDLTNENDYVLMSDVLGAAKDYSIGHARKNLKLLLWETTEKGRELIETGIAVADSPMKACVKVVEYLSSIYGVKIFNGNSNDIDDVKEFCGEYVDAVFEHRQK